MPVVSRKAESSKLKAKKVKPSKQKRKKICINDKKSRLRSRRAFIQPICLAVSCCLVGNNSGRYSWLFN